MMNTNKTKNSNTSNKSKNDSAGTGGSDTSKKKNVSKFKNILAQPIPQYWPEISEDDTTNLREILSNLKNEKNLKELGIILGLNSSLRKIKTGNISCILISTEIRPKFIVNQLIYMIISNYLNTKFLCVPNLKEITMNVFGVQSLVIAFVKNHQCLESIENWIDKKSKEFPIPEEILQYYGDKREEQQQKITENEKNCRKKEDEESSKETEKINFDELYLIRPLSNDKSKRAFIPDNAKNLKPINFEVSNNKSSTSSWGDYISFSETSTIKMDIDEDCKDQNSDSKSNQEEDIDDDEDDKVKLLNILERMKNLTDENKMIIKNEEITISNEKQNSIIDVSTVHQINQNTIKHKNCEEQQQQSDILMNRTNKKRKRKMISSSDLCDNALIDEPKFKYVSLKVNKIRGNQNRNRKKNKKNKK